jgi:hypothetical protein
VRMAIDIEGATEALEKRPRPWLEPAAARCHF